LSYIHKKMALEPYTIWIKKSADATDTQINNDIIDKNIKINNIKYSNQYIITRKNDPLLQGINGALTLGFVVTMMIATIGFLIYWIMSIQKRVLQFGIFRAMGLSLKKVIGMIACEQIMISGIAIVNGIICGGVVSSLFVPLLQLVYSSAEQVPPFKVIAYARDYEKIYIVVALMLVTGFIALGRFISRIRIDQAVKLGED
jgi:putative ABC transport system permease protein